MKELKKVVSFLDADGKRAKIDVEIEKKDDFFTFSASGEYCGSFGQCLDNIKPANDEQKELIAIWKRWHLNDLKAGNEAQEKALSEQEALEGYKMTYDEAIQFLDEKNLLCNDGYTYGEAWKREELPADLDERLISLISKIEADEEAKKILADKEEKSEEDKLMDKMDEYGIDEDNFEACKAYLEVMRADDLSGFTEAYSGKFDSDKDFAIEQAESIGALQFEDSAKWPYICIDWEQASKELMHDYVEHNGFYFRNC